MSFAYLSILIFLPVFLIPAWVSSSLAFRMMYSAYKLKLAEWQYTALIYSFPNFEPVHWSIFSSNCCFLTCIQVSQECRPRLLLPPIPPSIRVFSNESILCMRWPKYWSFSFTISPSKETPGLISFRMDWLDILAVQGTLKSLLQPQFKGINSSVLSFLYGPTVTSIHDCWKNHNWLYRPLSAK